MLRDTRAGLIEPTSVSAGAHRSACFLPVSAIGLGGDTEELRKKAVSEDRHEASAEVAEKIAAAPESEGSVIA